jgi:Protein of unknown function (DUF1579)
VKSRIAACLIVCAGLSIAYADEPQKPKEDLSKSTHGGNFSEETKQAVAAQMMADMQPGPQHKLLEGMTGSWKCITKHWMDPTQPEITLEHGSESKMILGGRFLEIKIKGEFFGMPFESLAIMGYDRRHEHYTTVGFDTMGTYYVTGEGGFDDQSKTLRLKGTTHDPKTGATERYTFVYRDMTPESFVSEVWFKTPDDKDIMIVQTTWARVK